MTVTVTVLPSLAGYSERANAVSDQGQVAGVNSWTSEAVAWNGQNVSALGILPGLSRSTALALNETGEIVGYSENDDFGGQQAFLWKAGQLTALGTVAGGNYSVATGINDTGKIVGYSGSGTSEYAVVWQDGAMTTLADLPGVTARSWAMAINQSGQIVGASGSDAALWQNGTVTDLGVLQGDSSCVAYAINASGVIVGNSSDYGGPSHAVVWQDGTPAALEGLAGGQATEAHALNDAGVIVGDAVTASGSYRAVLWQNGVITDLNSLLPANSGWILSEANGINDQGVIVGNGTYYGVGYAFELNLNGVAEAILTVQTALSAFASTSLPSAYTLSDSATHVTAGLDALQAIAAAGKLSDISLTDTAAPILSLTPLQLTQDFATLKKIVTPFSLSITAGSSNLVIDGLDGHVTTVQFNGPVSDYDIVADPEGQGFTVIDIATGRSSADVLTHVAAVSFSDGTVIASSAPPGDLSSLASIRQLPNALALTDLNNNGQVTAIGLSTSFGSVATLISQGQATTLNTSGWNSNAWGLNDQGDVVGTVQTASGEQPILWQDGKEIDLPGFGDYQSFAMGINDAGQIVGASASYNVASSGPGPRHAIFWASPTSTPVPLPFLPGDTASDAEAINDAGTIVGLSGDGTTLAGGHLAGTAVSWQDGQITALAALPAQQASWANAINRSGQIVGDVLSSDGTVHGVFWQNGTVASLISLSGYSQSDALYVNNLGQMVGDAYNDTSSRAVLWQNGQVVDLNSLLPANSGWVLTSADAINDSGLIVGDGQLNGGVSQVHFELSLSGSTASATQAVLATFTAGKITAAVALADSSTAILANLDQLQSLSNAGKLADIALTDGGTPNLTVTQAQFHSDGDVLSDISTTHTVTVQVTGSAASYDFASTGQFSGVSALQFDDRTILIAATPGADTVTTGNVTELYSAVLAREPDIAGLAYYQNYLKANPGTPLIQFAEWFLASSEYTGNSAHAYAQSTAGDAQFITDSYHNLLGRTPTADEVTYYQKYVLEPAVAGLTAGSSAYTAAQAQAHAQMLVYFSASAEFLKDVQITATTPADAQHWLVLT